MRTRGVFLGAVAREGACVGRDPTVGLIFFFLVGDTRCRLGEALSSATATTVKEDRNYKSIRERKNRRLYHKVKNRTISWVLNFLTGMRVSSLSRKPLLWFPVASRDPPNWSLIAKCFILYRKIVF